MLRRWLLALLVVCLAAPAMAMPLHCLKPASRQTHALHDNAGPDTTGHAEYGTTTHRHEHLPGKQPPRGADHGMQGAMAGNCIGCIVPAMAPAGAGDRVALSVRPTAPSGTPMLARLTMGPDTPPPRR